MKKLRSNKGIKILAANMILLAGLLCWTSLPASAVNCEAALLECSIDAGIVALFSGLQSGGLYLTGCFIGYSWCLEYFG
ncbi:MAG: hypothetical protein ACLFVG_09050 [Candidatus Aminicenantes bacterium]